MFFKSYDFFGGQLQCLCSTCTSHSFLGRKRESQTHGRRNKIISVVRILIVGFAFHSLLYYINDSMVNESGIFQVDNGKSLMISTVSLHTFVPSRNNTTARDSSLRCWRRMVGSRPFLNRTHVLCLSLWQLLAPPY